MKKKFIIIYTARKFVLPFKAIFSLLVDVKKGFYLSEEVVCYVDLTLQCLYRLSASAGLLDAFI